MRYIEVESYKEMSELASRIIADQINSKPNSVLGLATGSTPIGVYKELIEMNKFKQIDFADIITINLDEYVGLDEEDPQSYRNFMNNHLFDHININKMNTYLPNGKAKNVVQECQKYDDLINGIGGIDLQLLGIGHNGHIGFNEPCDQFIKNTHIVNLDDSTIEANSRFFDKIDDVPLQAITMGIGAIMKVQKILLIANGENKKDILHKAINGEISPQIPASILQLHPDVTVIYSKEENQN